MRTTSSPTNRNRWRDDAGVMSTMFAVLGLSLLMATGLAVDGGRKLGALSEARDIADNAARAGAQEIDEDALRLTGLPLLDEDAAAASAMAYLAEVGHSGVVVTTENSVTVTVTIAVQTVILPIEMDASATESAGPVEGI